MVNINDYWPVFSGAAIHLRRRFPLLRAHGIEPWVLTRLHGGLKKEEMIDDILVRRVNVRQNLTERIKFIDKFMFLPAIYKYRNDFDIALVMYNYLNGYFIKKVLNRPVVREITLLGSDDPMAVLQGERAKLNFKLYSSADAFVAISPALEKSCQDAGISAKSIKTISRGVDTEEFYPESNLQEKLRIRKDFNLPTDGGILFVSVGAVYPRKGTHRLISAWEKVVSTIPNAHLVIAGTNNVANYLSEVREQISTAKLDNRVHIIGECHKIPELLRGADGFVFASESEGMPNAILQAMATELPIVVQNIPDIIDYIIKTPETGIVVPPMDNIALAEGVIKLIKNTALGKSMGKLARQDVKKRFSFRKEVNGHTELYNELLLRK